MIQEVAQLEKKTRMKRIKNRMFWLLVVLNLVLFGYLVYEVITIIMGLIG